MFAFQDQDKQERDAEKWLVIETAGLDARGDDKHAHTRNGCTLDTWPNRETVCLFENRLIGEI